jgi:hypothetical protein
VPASIKRRFGQNSVNPFQGLRLGQWKFLFSSWNSSFVASAPKKSASESGSVLDPEEFLEASSVSPKLQVETQLPFAEETSFSAPLEPELPWAMEAQMQEWKTQAAQLMQQAAELKRSQSRVEAQSEQLRLALTSVERECQTLREETVNLRGRLATAEMLVGTRSHGMSADESELLEKLDQAVFAPSGDFAAIRHDLDGLMNKVNSGGGIEFHGFSFSCDRDCVQWYQANFGKVALLHSINATVVSPKK